MQLIVCWMLVRFPNPLPQVSWGTWLGLCNPVLVLVLAFYQWLAAFLISISIFLQRVPQTCGGIRVSSLPPLVKAGAQVVLLGDPSH